MVIYLSKAFSLIHLAFAVSRFRFWLYLGGTYMLGYILGANSLSQFSEISFIIHLIYFLIPANIFLYGINDLADQDTDQYNLKKGTKEVLISENEKQNDLKIIIVFVTILSIGIFFLQFNLISKLLFTSFYFLSFAYSFPPLRFKAKPFIDFSSNILYALPGILAYYQASNELPPVLMWISLYLWTGAMHLFSAIPDINADKQAGVNTTSVVLGKNVSLWICSIFWVISISIVVLLYKAFIPWSYIAFLYPFIPLSIIFFKDINIDKIYWFYPYINGLLGLGLSLLAGWDLLIQIFIP